MPECTIVCSTAHSTQELWLLVVWYTFHIEYAGSSDNEDALHEQRETRNNTAQPNFCRRRNFGLSWFFFIFTAQRAARETRDRGRWSFLHSIHCQYIKRPTAFSSHHAREGAEGCVGRSLDVQTAHFMIMDLWPEGYLFTPAVKLANSGTCILFSLVFFLYSAVVHLQQ